MVPSNCLLKISNLPADGCVGTWPYEILGLWNTTTTFILYSWTLCLWTTSPDVKAFFIQSCVQACLMLYANIQGAQMDLVTLNSCHFINVEDFKNVQLQYKFNPNKLFRLDLKNNGNLMLSFLSDVFLESGRDVLYCSLKYFNQSLCYFVLNCRVFFGVDPWFQEIPPRDISILWILYF